MPTRSPDKWFSMRTEYYGTDAFHLQFDRLSPQATALYISGIAYACRWGIDYAFRTQAHHAGIRRAKPVVDELVDRGFWVPLPERQFGVAHEGTLWRRGAPMQRRAIPLAIRAAVMERDAYACVNCEATDELTLDHVWPYSKGGEDTLENLRVLCRSCNSAKGARI